MHKKMLVVGIDPGTTTAYAITDIDGNVLKMYAAKDITLGDVIMGILPFGRILIAASDKHPCPALVSQFATKTGARLFFPKEDVSTQQKRELTRDFPTENIHQTDALSASLLALQHFGPLLKKIEVFVEKNKKQHLKERMIELVFRYEMSITTACDILEKPKQEEVVCLKKIIEKKEFSKEYDTLYQTARNLKKDNKLLREYAEQLREENKKILAEQEHLIKKVHKNTTPSEAKRLLHMRSMTIGQLEAKLSCAEERICGLTEQWKRLLQLFFRADEWVVLKKLKNLGTKEYLLKKSELNLKENDTLLVMDPLIFSKTVVEEIAKKCQVIVTSKKYPQELKQWFLFVDLKSLQLQDFETFALAKKEAFTLAKKQSDLLRNIVVGYKEGRR